ncbi:MAG: ECF transporter S component [Oscillospiraceae bacterium]|nr:ECF transporter S component [Oscillospiraceae bacterium]
MNKSTLSYSDKTRILTQFSILLALEVIVCFTPLGSIPIPGLMPATLMYLPVVVAAMMLGVKAGALMGFFSGLFSFIVWSLMPPNPIVAFIFTPVYSGDNFFPGNAGSLVICFVPRILVGVVAGVVFHFLSKRKAPLAVSCALSGLLGSLTATALVLGGIKLFFAAPNDTALSFIIGASAYIIVLSGLAEAVIAGIVGVGVCVPLKKILNRRG